VAVNERPKATELKMAPPATHRGYHARFPRKQ